MSICVRVQVAAESRSWIFCCEIFRALAGSHLTRMPGARLGSSVSSNSWRCPQPRGVLTEGGVHSPLDMQECGVADRLWLCTETCYAIKAKERWRTVRSLDVSPTVTKTRCGRMFPSLFKSNQPFHPCIWSHLHKSLHQSSLETAASPAHPWTAIFLTPGISVIQSRYSGLVQSFDICSFQVHLCKSLS